MTAETIFKQDYEKYLQHLKLKGPPRTKRLPDIVMVEEAAMLF